MTIASRRYCDASYETLQRNGESHISVCRQCGQEYCSRCDVSEQLGSQTWISRCPNCNSSTSTQLEIEYRSSIFSSPTDLRQHTHSLGVAFVPRSRTSKRSEELARAAAECLSGLRIEIALHDERDRTITESLTAQFPNQFKPDPDFGSGAMFWYTRGNPVAMHSGGPYLAKLDVLHTCKRMWTADSGEPSCAPKDGLHDFTNGCSTFRPR
jgi:hypothetical protein